MPYKGLFAVAAMLASMFRKTKSYGRLVLVQGTTLLFFRSFVLAWRTPALFFPSLAEGLLNYQVCLENCQRLPKPSIRDIP